MNETKGYQFLQLGQKVTVIKSKEKGVVEGHQLTEEGLMIYVRDSDTDKGNWHKENDLKCY